MPWIFSLILICISTTAFAEPKVVQIGFVSDSERGQNVDRFTNVLKQNINKKEITLEFAKKYNFSAENNMDSVRVALNLALKNKEIDIVIMTGPIGAKVASDLGKERSGLPKPVLAPVVFDATLQGIGTDINSNKSNIRNFNFATVPHIIENDLRAFTTVAGFYHIGVIVDETLIPTFEMDAREYIDDLSPMIRKVTLLPVAESGNKLLADYGARPADFQGIYLTSLSRMTEENEAILIQGLKKAKLPTFSMDGPSDVKRGALASLTPKNVDDLINDLLVQNVGKIALGAKAETLPILINIEGSLNINLETAEFLSIWPEWDVLAEAEIIGGKEVKALVVSDVITLSALNNPLVSLGGYAKEIKAQEYLQLRSQYLPQLEASLAGDFVDHDQRVQPLQLSVQNDIRFGLRLEQKIWSYETLAAMKIKETERAVEELNMVVLQQQITQDAVIAFLQLVEYQAIVEVYQRHFSLIRSQLDMARRIDQHGDVERMEAIFAQTKEEMLQAKSTAMEMEIILRQILSTDAEIGRPVQVLSAEEEKFLSYLNDPRTFDEVLNVLVQFASRKNLNVEIGRLEERALTEEVKSRKYAYWSPDVGLYAGMDQHLYRSRVTYSEDINSYNSLVEDLVASDDIPISDYSKYDILIPTTRNDTDWYLGLYMNLPVFTGFEKRSQLEQAQTELIQLEETNAYDMETLAFNLNKHLVRVNSLYRSIYIAEQTVKQSQRALDEVSKQYFAGELLLSELRDSSDVALHAAIKQQVLLGMFRQELFKLMSLSGLQDFYTKQDARDLLFASLEQHFLENGFPLPSIN
jgi:outer membrane protein